jgi:hypothetical protein
VCYRQRAAGLSGDLAHLWELQTAPFQALAAQRLAINDSVAMN